MHGPFPISKQFPTTFSIYFTSIWEGSEGCGWTFLPLKMGHFLLCPPLAPIFPNIRNKKSHRQNGSLEVWSLLISEEIFGCKLSNLRQSPYRGDRWILYFLKCFYNSFGGLWLYLSTIPTYNSHFNSRINSHFLLSRSGNSSKKNSHFWKQNSHFYLIRSENLSGN